MDTFFIIHFFLFHQAHGLRVFQASSCHFHLLGNDEADLFYRKHSMLEHIDFQTNLLAYARCLQK